MATTKHLWEVEHDYYCNEYNYYSNDTYKKFDGWEEFFEEFGNSDMDRNLIFRWDWHDKNNPDHEVEEDHLLIFWMMQRKGAFTCSDIIINKEDEAKVIAFLQPRFENLMKLWQPLEITEQGRAALEGGKNV